MRHRSCPAIWLFSAARHSIPRRTTFIRKHILSVSLAAVGWLIPALSAPAQNQGQGQGQNQNQQGQGGILIDAEGVLSVTPAAKRSEKLSRKKMEAAAAKSLPTELNQPSEMRMVSLPALEAECRRRLDAGETLTDEIRYLAGLQRIDYVFLFEESKDLVIAGPADGFAPNALNVMVGVTSQRPVLRLDDLLVALRSRDDLIGCSIDPVAERLVDVSRYLKSAGAAASISEAKARYNRMAELLGLQDVRVWGVDPASHFARVMVEADYRMKRISVGHDKPRVRGLRSYLDMKGAGTNSMRRWWFAPLYDTLERSDDGTVWKFNGQRVQMMAQDELVDPNGNRRDDSVLKMSTEQFARQFTNKYVPLAKQMGVFAELQNLFDLGIAAALIRRERMPAQVDWAMSLFLDPNGVPMETFAVPKHVPSIANARQAGRLVVVGVVGGGVRLDSALVLQSMETETKPRMESLRESNRRPADGPSQWWWDGTP